MKPVALNILYVTKLAPQFGTRRVHEVAKRLVSLGNRVTVLSAATRADQPRIEVVDGIKVIAARTAPRRFRTDSPFGFLATRLPLYAAAPSIVRREISDVDVIVEDVAPFSTPMLPRAARRIGAPLIYQIHNVYESRTGWMEAYGRPGIAGAVQEHQLRSSPACDAIYSDAKWTVDSLGDLGIPVEWIPNGVDGELFRPDPSRRIDDGTFRIVNVGRLVALKNQALLLDALAPLRSLPFELRIFGFGPEEERLTRRIDELGLGDKVQLLPHAPRTDLIAALQQADLFALPSKFEGMPLSALEALSSGVPVAMSDIPAADGVIEPPFGWRLPIDSAAPWSDLLRTLISESGYDLERMGVLGRSYALDQFDWDKTTEAELDLFRRAIADKT